LDRDGDAEMSCISGVGGNVPHLVKIAQSGRPILALDGCALACTLHCLSERGLTPDYHLQLHEHGVKKNYHADFDVEHAKLIAGEVAQQARRLRGQCVGGTPDSVGLRLAGEGSKMEPGTADRRVEEEYSRLTPDDILAIQSHIGAAADEMMEMSKEDMISLAYVAASQRSAEDA
jgi:uncharacterized metal-binding protein